MSIFWVGLPVLAIAGWLLWGWYYPAGLPINAGAYRNDTHHFAISAPDGWTLLPAGQESDIPDATGGVFGNRMLLKILKPTTVKNVTPTIAVILIPSELERFSDKNKSIMSLTFADSLKTVLPSYQTEQTDLIFVDKLRSLRLMGRATVQTVMQKEVTRQVRIYAAYFGTEVVTPAVYADLAQKLMLTIVPGGQHSFLIVCLAEPDMFEAHRAVFDEAVASFRVLQRPTPIGVPGTAKNTLFGILWKVGVLVLGIVLLFKLLR